jgi:hypothetical protein
MGSTNPARPAAEKTLLTQLNGAPMFPPFPGLGQGQLVPGNPSATMQTLLGVQPASGVLTSTGAAVNNLTTATPFAVTPVAADGFTRPLIGSMAGRVYLVHAIAAGFLMPSESPLVNDGRYWTVASTATVPPVVNTFPGVPMNAGDVRELVMLSTQGWLQWISASGTASLVCWELL